MSRQTLSNRFFSSSLILLFAFVFLSCKTDEVQAKSKRGWLGVSVEEMTPSMREEMKLGNRSGLLIVNVVPDSPADDAGLREDDVLIKYAGKNVEKADDFVALVRNTEPNSAVKITIFRDGSEKEVEATLGKKRSRGFHYFGMGDEPNFVFLSGRPLLGVQLQELNKDLAQYFNGVEKGALVVSVVEESPAEKAGLKAGDIITKIDDATVESPEDLMEALTDYEAGETARLEYIRKGAAAKAQVKLEKNDEMSSKSFERFFPRAHPNFKWHGSDGGVKDKNIKIIVEDGLKDGVEI